MHKAVQSAGFVTMDIESFFYFNPMYFSNEVIVPNANPRDGETSFAAAGFFGCTLCAAQECAIL